jgi:tetratricopeptide (TPR) repeat protein
MDLPAPTLRFAGTLVAAICLLALAPAHIARGQGGVIEQAGRFDPSDVYFQGYLAARAAENFEAEGKHAEALGKYQEAQRMFDSVAKFFPEWKPEMVQGRAERNRESTAAVRQKAEEQQAENQRVVAELEGGQRVGGEWKPAVPQPRPQGILEVDPMAVRKLKEAEDEIARLRGLLDAANAGETAAARNESRVRDLQRQRDDLQGRLRGVEAEAGALRARLAAAPVESQLTDLNRRIDDLEQERSAMGIALTQSRRSHTEAMAKIATLEADMGLLREETVKLRQREADLTRNLERERNVANDVVAGLRRQMQELNDKLTAKDGDLARANTTIASLTRELQESRDAYSELRDERDNLLRERDQMAALLQLNEGGRIDDLIDQNVGLDRQLREAAERVDILSRDNNATKDELTDARRDLAIAKAQIQRMRQEHAEQHKRIDEIRRQLRDEEHAIAVNPSVDPAEANVLREIIHRHLRIQAHRRQSRDLLIDTVRERARDDENLARAIEVLEGSEIELTPDEQRIIADNQVDGEFISPFARDRKTVDGKMTGLNLELESFDRAATRAFTAGRYLPARELYEQMIELHPGHTPALCKLGVVQLRLEEPAAAADTFRRAAELEPSNAYAHRMLALALMTLGDLAAAREPANRSVEITPDDPVAQMMLGAVYFRLGETRDAEAHFKAAISADPMLSEPYFNLAVLHAREKRFDRAREHYNQALERGAVPDPALEKSLFQ